MFYRFGQVMFSKLYTAKKDSPGHDCCSNKLIIYCLSFVSCMSCIDTVLVIHWSRVTVVKLYQRAAQNSKMWRLAVLSNVNSSCWRRMLKRNFNRKKLKKKVVRKYPTCKIPLRNSLRLIFTDSAWHKEPQLQFIVLKGKPLLHTVVSGCLGRADTLCALYQPGIGHSGN